MTLDAIPFGEYYCLRNRSSLTIDPWTDSKIYFGAGTLSERVSKRLETDFVQPRGVPKFFVHGSFGSGKTHTLAHIQYVLENELSKIYQTECIYIDIAPLGSKEKYERIHGRLIDAVGLDRIRSAAEAFADGHPSKDKVEAFLQGGALAFGDQALRTSQANVFRNLLFGGRGAQLSWEWLKGRRVTVDEAQTLNTQKSLSEPQDYVNCLLNVGALYFAGAKKKLVFLIDEAEAFRSVTNPDANSELRHCLRLLLENSNRFVGCVFAIQVEGGQESVGDFFESDDIRRRVDYEQGYIDLNGGLGAVEDAKAFMLQLLEYVIDRDKAKEVIAAEGLTVHADTFPFTDEALTTFGDHCADNPEKALPAAIISWMSGAAIEGWRARAQSETRQVVSREMAEQAIFPGD